MFRWTLQSNLLRSSFWGEEPMIGANRPKIYCSRTINWWAFVSLGSRAPIFFKTILLLHQRHIPQLFRSCCSRFSWCFCGIYLNAITLWYTGCHRIFLGGIVRFICHSWGRNCCWYRLSWRACRRRYLILSYQGGALDISKWKGNIASKQIQFRFEL